MDSYFACNLLLDHIAQLQVLFRSTPFDINARKTDLLKWQDNTKSSSEYCSSVKRKSKTASKSKNIVEKQHVYRTSSNQNVQFILFLGGRCFYQFCHIRWLIFCHSTRELSKTPWIVKGNKSLNLVWFKWGSQWWGILKHFPQSRCILISHWSREK